MYAKDAAMINRSVDFAEGQFCGLAFQESSAVRTSQSSNESRILELDQESADNDWVSVHGLRQTRRGATISLLQCEHSHHMYRKGKSATLHLVSVTAQITLSRRKGLDCRVALPRDQASLRCQQNTGWKPMLH